MLTNDTVTEQYGSMKINYNIYHIDSYKYDSNVEDIISKNISDDDNILVTSYILMSWY